MVVAVDGSLGRKEEGGGDAPRKSLMARAAARMPPVLCACRVCVYVYMYVLYVGESVFCVCVYICVYVCVRTNVVDQNITESVSYFPCLDELHRIDTEGAKSGERA